LLFFSLDYIEEDNYHFHKGKNLLHETCINIKNYNNTKNKNTITFLQFLIHRLNYKKTKQLLLINNNLNCNYVILKKGLIYSNEYNNYSVKSKNINNTIKQNKKFNCKFIYYSIKLNSDGSLSPCCNDVNREITIAYEKWMSNFNRAWNSKKWQKLRTNSKKSIPSLKFCLYCQKLQKKKVFLKIKKQ
jgi:hypothetical protein